MNQVIWFDNLCLFTMGGVFSGWFYRCGSRMYDEDVEVQLVTYGTTPLTLVCSVWDSVQIYTACFLHFHVFSCHQIKCAQGQMFMRHMPLRSYRIINSCCPNYDIRMLGYYFVSGIPLWKGPPFKLMGFLRVGRQPAPADAANRPGVIHNRRHNQRPRSRNRRRHDRRIKQISLESWIPDAILMMYFDVFCYFVIYLSFGLQRELARSDQLLRWWDNGLGWVIREGGTLYNSAFMIEYRPQNSKTGNARAVGIVLLQLHNMIWYV